MKSLIRYKQTCCAQRVAGTVVSCVVLAVVYVTGQNLERIFPVLKCIFIVEELLTDVAHVQSTSYKPALSLKARLDQRVI